MSPKNPSSTTSPNKSDNQQPVSKLVVGAEPVQKISLYVRAANWLKDRENALSRFQAINPKIKAVRHPRQKSADFCFIDFASVADRDQVFAELQHHSELTVKPVTTDVPQLLERSMQKISASREKRKEARALKKHIEKLAKKAKSSKPISTEIYISKLPRAVTVPELKTQFPSSIDVRLNKKGNAQQKTKTHSAIVVFATPQEAFDASRKPLELHDEKVNVRLNVERKRKAEGVEGKSKRPKLDVKEDVDEEEVLEEDADQDDENDQESIAEEEQQEEEESDDEDDDEDAEEEEEEEGEGEEDDDDDDEEDDDDDEGDDDDASED